MPQDEFAGPRWTRQARNAYPKMRPVPKMEAVTSAEAIGVVPDSARLIKAKQCVDIMVFIDSWRRKIVQT
ncbi:hypothetical protein XH87_27700 [Bradyrhizobium sp. CCBAU 53415]|nr:hypothetical protein [Bradyrhizobium sp. CCBAU 53415]